MVNVSIYTIHGSYGYVYISIYLHYMVFYYMYKYMIVLFLIYVDNYTCRPGVPPRGLSWDQPLRVSLEFIRVSFVFIFI